MRTNAGSGLPLLACSKKRWKGSLKPIRLSVLRYAWVAEKHKAPSHAYPNVSSRNPPDVHLNLVYDRIGL